MGASQSGDGPSSFLGELDRKITWGDEKAQRPDHTAIDIGANLGLVYLSMLQCVGPSGTVHAFEPQTHMADYTTRSIVFRDAAPKRGERLAFGKSRARPAHTLPTAKD